MADHQTTYAGGTLESAHSQEAFAMSDVMPMYDRDGVQHLVDSGLHPRKPSNALALKLGNDAKEAEWLTEMASVEEWDGLCADMYFIEAVALAFGYLAEI
jgi:hypothetical protein